MLRILFTRNNLAMSFYIAVSVFMILTRGSDVSLSLRQGGSSIVISVQSGANTLLRAVKNAGTEFTEVWQMRKHYKKMQEKIHHYGYYELEARRLALENERLRMVLGFPDAPQYRQVHGRIIARDVSDIVQGFTIDKGALAGLQPKMLVLAYNAERDLYGVVGRVQEVFANSARIVPINYPQFFLATKVLPSGYEGLVDGGSWTGDRLLINYISPNALPDLSLGDLVVTSAVTLNEESFIIANLYVGEVIEVVNDPTKSSLQLVLKSAVDLTRLEYVTILIAEELTHQVHSSSLRAVGASSIYEEYYAQQQEAGLAYEELVIGE